MIRAPKSDESTVSGTRPKQGTATRLVLIGHEATADEVLHARVAPKVNRLLWAFLGADPDRDDLAQDIFIRILRGARSLREPGRVEEWAARVAINCIKNEFRRRSFRRWLSLEPHQDELRYHTDFEGRELVTRTQRILERMPASERIPLTLRLLEDTSLEELARLCDCSVRTVKRRLKSGRERFLRLARHDPVLSSRLPAAAEGGESNDA